MMKKYLTQANVVTSSIIKELLTCKSGEVDKSDKRQFFYYSILFKSIHAFEGALFLVPYFQIKPFFQIAFISGIRDIILDIISAEFISLKELEQGVDVQQELQRIYRDHYVSTDKIRPLNKKMFGQTEKYGEIENQFIQAGLDIRSENGKISSSLRPRSTFSKIEYIHDNSFGESREYSRILFTWYNLTSKVSHFGEWTLGIILDNFSDAESEQFKHNCKELIETILIYCSGLLKKINKDYEEKSIVNEELMKLIKMKFDA